MKAGLTHWADYTVIGVYFVVVLVVGLSTVFRKNRESVQGYFLAGRTMTWLPIGASLFASNIGSEHFIGLAGSGAASGIAVVLFEWGAVILLVLLGWVFLPIYLSSGVFTMPEYLGARFGGKRMRIYLACVAMALYVVTKISVDMYAGVFFIQMATGIDMYLAIVGLLVVTAIYTVAGGLAAVVFTDALQTVVMLGGAVALSIMAFMKINGLPGLMEKYPHAIAASEAGYNNTLSHLDPASDFTSIAANNSSSLLLNTTMLLKTDHHNVSSCAKPRGDAFHIFRDPINSDLPWPGVVFRATFASLWNWCADQVIVQRALASKSMAHAKAATIMAGYLKFTPLFLIIFPGMISRVLYTDEVACFTKEACEEQCGNEAGCSNSAYPALILNLAPVGMKGLLMAVMVAALMSSLTSIFNSAVTVFTMDLYRRVRSKAKERELLLVGRLFVIVLVGISIAWVPFVKNSQEGQLFLYIQAVTGYIAPPISAIFLMAVFIPRINEKGAFWGVASGQAVGVVRFVLDFVYPSPGCGNEDNRPSIVADLHFTYFSIVVFCVAAIVALVVSLLTQPQPKDQLKNLTLWTLPPISQQRRRQGDRGESSSVILETAKCNPTSPESNGMRNLVVSDELDNEDDRLHPYRLQDTGLDKTGKDPADNNSLGREPYIDFRMANSKQNVPKEKSYTQPFDRFIRPWLSLVLNINAGFLLVVLIFLCIMFH